MLKDYYMFFANFSGLVLGIFYAVTSMCVMFFESKGSRSRDFMILETSLVGGSLVYGIVALFVGLVIPSDHKQYGRILVAVCANLCSVCYYGSPLTSIYEVVSKKDSSSLYPPMLLANAVNSSMWFIYGVFALNDPFVYGPNGIGASLAYGQLVLAFLYAKKKDPVNKSLLEV
jgi:solute carrier family 50 (sugar transporter)